MLEKSVLGRSRGYEREMALIVDKRLSMMQRWAAAHHFRRIRAHAKVNYPTPAQAEAQINFVVQFPGHGSSLLDVRFDLKASAKRRVYIETVANEQAMTPGWIYRTQADRLVYVTAPEYDCWWIEMSRLKAVFEGEWMGRTRTAFVSEDEGAFAPYASIGVIISLSEFLDALNPTRTLLRSDMEWAWQEMARHFGREKG